MLSDDPYSGERNYHFDMHDNDYATDLDAEHIVALGNAWVTGRSNCPPSSAPSSRTTRST